MLSKTRIVRQLESRELQLSQEQSRSREEIKVCPRSRLDPRAFDIRPRSVGLEGFPLTDHPVVSHHPSFVAMNFLVNEGISDSSIGVLRMP